MELDFSKLGGLVPAIVQDAGRGEVLMLGFMNEQALEGRANLGEVTFFSRSRKKLWTQGRAERSSCCGCAKCAWIATPTRCWCAWTPSGRACATKVIAVVFSGG